MDLHPGRVRSTIFFLVLIVASFWCTRRVAGATERPAARTHTISIRGFKFIPDTLTVNVGDTVLWKNADIVPHTVTAVDESFSSGEIAPGGKWKFVAKKAGSFPYACTPHPNMKATLIVQ